MTTTVPAIRTFYTKEGSYGVSYRVSQYMINTDPYHLDILIDKNQIYIQRKTTDPVILENTKIYNHHHHHRPIPMKIECTVPVKWIEGCIQVVEARTLQSQLIQQEPLPDDQLTKDAEKLNKEADRLLNEQKYELAYLQALESVKADSTYFYGNFTLAECLHWLNRLDEAVDIIIRLYTLPENFETPMQIQEWIYYIYDIWDKQASSLLPNIYQNEKIANVINNCKSNESIRRFKGNQS